MSRVGEVMDASQKPPSPQERSPTQSKWTKLRKLIFHTSKRKEKERGCSQKSFSKLSCCVWSQSSIKSGVLEFRAHALYWAHFGIRIVT